MTANVAPISAAHSHDAAAALEALAIIFGPRPRQVIALDPASGAETSAVFAAGDDTGFAAWLAERRTSNIYYGHAERKPGTTQRRKADLIAVYWLHVDVDPRKGEDVDAERRRILALLTTGLPEGVPQPTLIFDSGRGYQVLWRLEEPMTNFLEAEQRNAWLRDQLGGDNVHDVPRILRLPGTVNWKPEAQGRRACIASHRPDAIYSPDQFGTVPLRESGSSERDDAIEAKGIALYGPLDRPEDFAAGVLLCRTMPPADGGAPGRDAAFTLGKRLKDVGLSFSTAFDLAVRYYDPRGISDPTWLHERIDQGYFSTSTLPGVNRESDAKADFAGVDIAPGNLTADVNRDPLEWGDEGGDDVPLIWVLKGILTRPGVGIVFGAPKSGKSFVLFDLAARLTLNMPWFDVRTPKRPIGALLLLGEGAGTVRTRLRAFERANGVERVPVAWKRISNLSSPEGIEAARRIIANARAGFAKRGIELAIIGVDSLASTLGLENENDAAEVTAALKRLEDLAVEFDVSVVGVHHAGLNGQVRGSSAFRASCDVMIRVQREDPRVGGTSSYREIEVMLNRWGEEGWTSNFRLERAVLGVDEDGDEITSCVVRPAGESPAKLNKKAFILAQFAPDVIGWNGARLPDGERGYTREALRARCEVVFDLKGDALRKAVYDNGIKPMVESGTLKAVISDGEEYFVLVETTMGGDIAPASLF